MIGCGIILFRPLFFRQPEARKKSSQKKSAVSFAEPERVSVFVIPLASSAIRLKNKGFVLIFLYGKVIVFIAVIAKKAAMYLKPLPPTAGIKYPKKIFHNFLHNRLLQNTILRN